MGKNYNDENGYSHVFFNFKNSDDYFLGIRMVHESTPLGKTRYRVLGLDVYDSKKSKVVRDWKNKPMYQSNKIDEKTFQAIHAIIRKE